MIIIGISHHFANKQAYCPLDMNMWCSLAILLQVVGFFSSFIAVRRVKKFDEFPYEYSKRGNSIYYFLFSSKEWGSKAILLCVDFL